MPIQTPDESAPPVDPIVPPRPPAELSAQELLAQVRADVAKNLNRDAARPPRPAPAPSPQLQEIQARLAQLRAQQGIPGMPLQPRIPKPAPVPPAPVVLPRERVAAPPPEGPSVAQVLPPLEVTVVDAPGVAEPVEPAVPEAITDAAPPAPVEVEVPPSPIVAVEISEIAEAGPTVEPIAPVVTERSPVEIGVPPEPSDAAAELVAMPVPEVLEPPARVPRRRRAAPAAAAPEPLITGPAIVDVLDTEGSAAPVLAPWWRRFWWVVALLVVAAVAVTTWLVLRGRGVVAGSCAGATAPALADDGASGPPVPVTGLVGDATVGCFLTPDGAWYGSSLPLTTVGGVKVSDATVPVQDTSRASLVLQGTAVTADEAAAEAMAAADIGGQTTLTVSDQGATKVGPARAPAYCYTGDFASTGLPAVKACYIVTPRGLAVLTVRATAHDAPLFAVFDSYRPS